MIDLTRTSTRTLSKQGETSQTLQESDNISGKISTPPKPNPASNSRLPNSMEADPCADPIAHFWKKPRKFAPAGSRDREYETLAKV
jgi:hypothetical protein